MLKIGITGGIGSGKTTICKIFETFGIPVFYADTVAKQLMTSDDILVQGIKAAFGELSYSKEGILDKKYLANIVFNNEVQLAKLNSLVHPAVFRAFDKWESSQTAAPYVLKEAALLFESGSYKSCDFTILVTAPRELRIKRVMQRDAVSAEQVIARINKQLDDEEKEKMADFFINNDEVSLLIPQVLDLHINFIKMASNPND